MRSMPYQSVLLRLLHGALALLTLLALGSGFWVYNTYDGRWGRVPLPLVPDIQGIHGTIALTTLLLFPLFALYSFHLGSHRLLGSRQVQQRGRAGWLTLQRLGNTLMLMVLTLALLSGRLMKEEWLPAGELNRPAYLAHLSAWLAVLVALAAHLVLGLKVGGLPLLRSMFSLQIRSEDRWPRWLRGLQTRPNTPLLQGLEIVVLVGIGMAFVLPALVG